MTIHTQSQDYIIADRGGIVENRHMVHAAIVDADGKILYAVGDPSRVTLARSAAKPAQALAVLETGACDQFGFDTADLALMCASHNSERRHIVRARSMLAKAGAEDGDLRCGGHPALSETVNREWIKADYTPTGICNNCSGKHAGMLAGARAIGAGMADYHLPDHPTQLRVKAVVEDLCGVGADSVKWGIDGCNLPAPAAPLHLLAQIYAFFAASANSGPHDGTASPRTRAACRVFHAMVQHPEMVAGDDRFCTALIQTFQGMLIGKVGAEGFYGIGIRASEQTKRLGAEGAVGIAVKIEDGNTKILYSAVVEILQQLNVGTPEMYRELSRFHGQPILNTFGVVTGHISHQFEVRRIQCF